MIKEIDIDIIYIQSVLLLGKIQSSDEINLRENLWIENRKNIKIKARKEIRLLEKKENRKLNWAEKENYTNRMIYEADKQFKIEVIKIAKSYE